MSSKLRFFHRNNTPIILQSEAAECGLACLAMVAGYHGHHMDLRSLRARFSVSLKGVTVAQLIKVAGELGLNTRPLRLEPEHLSGLKLPVILHWDLNHFVVLVAASRKGMTIHDPGKGIRHYSLEEFSKHFTGVALELSPSQHFQKQEKQDPIKVQQLIGGVRGLGKTLGQIFLLAAVLEVFALAAPLFMQLVVDQAIVTQDHDLLTVLGIGFLLLMLAQVGVTTLRSWVVLYLSTHLNLHMVTNLFRHLLRLPVRFFQNRHLGDVVSRFESLNVIQRTLTNQFIEAVVDGIMVIATLIMIAIYSTELCLVVCVAALLYGALRFALYRPLKQASEEQIICGARQHSNFLESVRGIQSIKLFNRQSHRQAQHENLVVDHFNAGIRVEKLQIAFQTLNKLLFGIENIVVVWIGAKLVLAGGFSVGMLFAFMAYKQQFTSRFSRLVENLIEFRVLTLHTERVADIAFAEAEPEESLDKVPVRRLGSHVEVRNLSVRYATSDPLVLNNLSFRIEEGESVAIVGPSGCGKSTLLKAMLGLIPATEGEILIGGVNLQRLGAQQYRDFIGTVMQDDELFAGTIGDNIAFFATEPDRERIETCALLASVHQDIMAMPMGYDTLIGDMGTVLSSGQKQRVLLARALYKQPRILFLDEATSHLDIDAEQRVNQAISQLNLTRIIIAHRPDTIASADRVIELSSVMSIAKNSLVSNCA